MKAKIYVGPPMSGKTRVAKMIAEHLGEDKVVFLSGRELKKIKLEDILFFFIFLTNKTELIIIDDVPINFDYSYFFHIQNDRIKGGELQFEIPVEKKCEKPKKILVPQLIIITEKLDAKWVKNWRSFNALFDIVDFPLHNDSYSEK